MKDFKQFRTIRLAMKKLYPSWELFIDDLIDRLEPFWLGTQSQDTAHFIQIIGYGKREKARAILTDLLELHEWQCETVFLWENWDNNAPSYFNQVLDFQKAYPFFPKVVVTDFFCEFFAAADSYREKCNKFHCIEEFLWKREKLETTFFDHPAADARGSLIVSFVDSFGDQDFIQTRLLLKFLWDNPTEGFNQLRKTFVPGDIERMIEKEYIKQEELIFFSKDSPFRAQMAFDLQEVTSVIAGKGSELLGIPVSISFNAMDYFLVYVFYKKLNYSKLLQAGLDFFLPVFRQYPRMTGKVNLRPEKLELDFKGGWKFNLTMD